MPKYGRSRKSRSEKPKKEKNSKSPLKEVFYPKGVTDHSITNSINITKIRELSK